MLDCSCRDVIMFESKHVEFQEDTETATLPIREMLRKRVQQNVRMENVESRNRKYTDYGSYFLIFITNKTVWILLCVFIHTKTHLIP